MISSSPCTPIPYLSNYHGYSGSPISIWMQCNLTIGNTYRTLRHNNNNNTTKQFCSGPQPFISNISKHNASTSITKNFNIDLPQINERSESNSKTMLTSLVLMTDCSQALHSPRGPHVFWYNGFLSLYLFCHCGHLEMTQNKFKYAEVRSIGFPFFYDELPMRFQDVSLVPDLCADTNDNCELFESIVLDTMSKCLTPKLLDSTSINIGFPSGSLMVFSIRVDINIYCSGKSLPNRTDFHISLSVNLATYQTILKNQSWQPNVNITLTSFRKKNLNLGVCEWDIYRRGFRSHHRFATQVATTTRMYCLSSINIQQQTLYLTITQSPYVVLYCRTFDTSGRFY